MIDWASVTVGENVYIGPFCDISNCDIGDGCWIGSHVVIGSPPEHSGEKYEFTKHSGRVKIGRNVVVREFSTITCSTSTLTSVGDSVYIMGRCHVAHDCVIENDAVLSIGSTLAGWTTVMESANVGIGAVTHQFTTIGPYAMIAGNAMVVKDVPPLAKYIPGKPLRINVYAVRKFNLGLGDVPVTESEQYAELCNRWEAKRHKERTVYSFAKGL